ncbi:MAG: hypothetical protein KJP21_02805 [Bacteroidia bacterium]|nr:hypothetical protein [Bacteroidia bacterium]NNJ54644.1 hypothetical protein [Bacteroidia bacterium]
MPKSYLIRKATIISPGHSNHLKKSDILIANGLIEKIGTKINAKATEISGKELYVSVGWFDLKTHLTDPGFEFKDSLENILETAASGGFTGICTLPNTQPVVNTKSAINYLKKIAESAITNLYPTGMVSDEQNAENLAEIFDMFTAGASAFTNGDIPISNGLLKKALLYTKPFNATIISQPIDMTIHQNGLVNESEATVHTGLKTSPTLAEYISVKQQIEIAEYCDAPLHIGGITCKQSVDLIAAAKKRGLKITCDTSIFNLCFTDNEVLTFDENFKIYPLLRSEIDRKALIRAVKSGVIDAISSNHNPQNIESKQVEFDYADFGSLSLQFIYPWYLQYLSKSIDFEVFVERFTAGARNVLNLDNPEIIEGQKANVTVFDAKENWVFNQETNKSLSRNTHMWNKEIVGKVVAVFNENKVNLYS